MYPQAHIIGRGIIGLATAFALQEAGWRVSVIGPIARPGSATRAAVGVSSLRGQIATKSPLFAAKMRGHALLPGWLDRIEAASGQSIRRSFNGLYEPFYGDEDYDRLVRGLQRGQPLAAAVAEIIASNDLHAHLRRQGHFLTKELLQPFQACNGVIYYPNDGWFDADATLNALEEALRRRGALFYDWEVERLASGMDGDVEIVSRHYAHPILRSSQVVLAAGIFANEILTRCEVSYPQQQAVAGSTLILRPQHGQEERRTATLALRFGKLNILLTEAGYRIGSTSENLTTSDYREFTEAAVDSEAPLLWAAAARYLGESALTDASDIACGVRGRFDDRYPALGWIRLANGGARVLVSLGFYKNGLQLAPLFASYAANLLAGSGEIPPEFSASRFEDNA